MTLPTLLRRRRPRRTEPTEPPEDRLLIALVNEARTDAARDAIVRRAALTRK